MKNHSLRFRLGLGLLLTLALSFCYHTTAQPYPQPGVVNNTMVSNIINNISLLTSQTNTVYFSPSGNNANPGTNVLAPVATLSQACSNITAFQTAFPGTYWNIYGMAGPNSNEIPILTNFIIFPTNTTYNQDPSCIIVLTNRNTRGVGGPNKAQFISVNAGDTINNMRLVYRDFIQNRGYAIGANSTVNANAIFPPIPPNNPCVINNIQITSDSGALHFEQAHGGTNSSFIVVNNPTVIAQGECFYAYAIYGNITVNNPYFILTNSAPLGFVGTVLEPYDCASVGGSTNNWGWLTVNGGSFNYSDAGTNWPSAAIKSIWFTGYATTNNLNSFPAIFNGVTLNNNNTNPVSYDLSAGWTALNHGQTNTLLLYHVVKGDGTALTETNLDSPVSMVDPKSDSRSFNFPPAPVVITPPATTAKWTNMLGKGTLFIDNTAVTMSAIKKNNGQISQLITDCSIPVSIGDYVSETYTVGTPAWTFTY